MEFRKYFFDLSGHNNAIEGGGRSIGVCSVFRTSIQQGAIDMAYCVFVME
jgi:hypothetical protein